MPKRDSEPPSKPERRKMPPGPGRPRNPVPAGADYLIDDLAAQGYSIAHIARHLDTDSRTLRGWLERDPKLQAAFDNGRERERLALHNALYTAATRKGNIVAGIFLLKARHGYREGDSADGGNRVNVTFNLPGAMKPEQFVIQSNERVEPIALPREGFDGT